MDISGISQILVTFFTEMEFSTKIAFILIVLFTAFLLYNRKNLDVQKVISWVLYVVLFRGKYGIKSMDKWSKRFPRTLRYAGIFGIGLGYLGMVAIGVVLVKGLFDFFFVPDALPSVMPVLPINVSWAVHVPLLYFILCIPILAAVHEFAHGIIARRYDIPVKSSGFGFIGLIVPILPLAFVEPDDKKLRKAKPNEQLSVYAAGATSNVFLAIILAAIFFLTIPALANNMMLHEGAKIVHVEENDAYPAYAEGVTADELILSLDGVEIEYLTNLTMMLHDKGPGETVQLETDRANYSLTLAPHPENPEYGYLGVNLVDSVVVKQEFIDKWGAKMPGFLMWIVGLMKWLIILNLGVGLFNFIPIGPIDGGRMMIVTLQKYFPEKKAFKIWKFISTVFLFLLLLNLATLFLPYILP